MEYINITEIKTNEKNPRTIDKAQLEKLKKSIREFPEMLEQRPIIIDETNTALGGNMRLQACIALKLKQIPVNKVTNWSQDQKDEFIIKDNLAYGEWEWKSLNDGWAENKLGDWGLINPMTPDDLQKKPEITDQEFNQEMEKINDENAQLAIVPEFHEKYSYFIILCDNEIDEEFIRNSLDLTGKQTSHKSTDNRRANIITFEKFQEQWLKRK